MDQGAGEGSMTQRREILSPETVRDLERGCAKLFDAYRRRGETILAVLEWAAPDKERERRLRNGSEPLSVDYREEQRLIAS